MNRGTEKQLIRLLQGELPESEERVLRQRLDEDEDLRRSYSSLRDLWQALEPATVEAVPEVFTSRVVRHATAARVSRVQASPLWARAAAAAALVAGIALGALLASPADSEEWAAWTTTRLTQAEVYWEALGQEAEGSPQEDLR